MGYLTEVAQQASTGPGVDFWAALISFGTAVVVTAGPAIVRKLFPGDSTVADIAKSSTERIANSLDSTLALVKQDLGALHAKVEDNGRKLDAIGKERP